MNNTNNTSRQVKVFVIGFTGLCVAIVALWISENISKTAVKNTTQALFSSSPSSPPARCQQLGAQTICSKIADVPNVPKGIFNYGGSTTFAPLRKGSDIFKRFGKRDFFATINQAHPEFQLRYTEPLAGNPGSGNGIDMLLEGQLSFSQSSRALKDEELEKAQSQNFKLEQIPIAIDGIAFYVNPQLVAQGLKGITLAQARGIFTGRMTNWKQVGGPDVAIAPFSRNLEYGGTVDFFYEKVLAKQSFGTNVQEVRDTTESIRKVAKTPGGISYATTSEAINQNSIRVLPLAKEVNSPFVSPCADDTCTAINKTAFVDGSYPITRRLFVLVKRNGGLDEEAGVAYANILLSNEGQKFVEQAGFVPLRNP
ncbi:PstS family phosphate ABC transporter substrate-binding protein [Mastigocladopsis repens]|uniref:PstS family phosphate ABC transporter substrate-binding protein n=1 Tax=Mastigocladopsis repens TaxID=221287 RepID=UPI0003026678|nr:PstS family phosphate ABC transporter substrate-binding protein [Mastigocladopsis repens]